MDSFIAIIIAIVFFITGIIGSILPVLPGVILIYLGMLSYGILTGFSNLSTTFFLIQGAATGLVLLIDYLAAALGAKKFGASNQALLGTIIGLFLGTVTLGLPGLILGPFLGAFLAELIKGTEIDSAFKTSLGTFVGFAGGIAVKLFIEVIMILWFFITIWS
ncbi:DUF456 domain-containing protein [Natranaerobius thermophilus]|uniref:DUF456 domain-containing protein n=1 Tax=Natranaerobius thermophilus (strain ATCC BAA-1301 / DSM 18059 / JW/NM-WN-LF) TaxID=457570 RepID=B2A0H7_NATTJ|nr:DUF456 domain-containing protein [Natranaerobius thermophilus]ACB84538.1 protein of unknown function DUF456 [Natranaerobius thermophilus JW/NM-WN-LF]